MSYDLKRAAMTAGKLFVVFGAAVAGILSARPRVNAASRKANSPERIARRKQMRRDMRRAARDPEFVREMSAMAAEWDVAAGDGLAGA
jgi:hypothetical protein